MSILYDIQILMLKFSKRSRMRVSYQIDQVDKSIA